MNLPVVGILPRSLEPVVRRRLEDEAVIVVNGPRTTGKSTLLRRLASEVDRPVFDLDDLSVRRAVAADPAFIAGAPAPVFIDEFQHVPELLDAIKSELNRDFRPGRFLLTGSTRYLTLPAAAQSLTGRIHVMELWPFSQPELEQTSSVFLEVLLSEPERLVGPGLEPISRPDVVKRCLAGGLPLALRRSDVAARQRWFADYVRLVVERDVLEIRKVRQREVLPRLLRRLAAQTGQVLNVSRAASEVGTGIDKTVAEDYTKLLEAVYLVLRLPAWGRTLRSRVTALPKLHMVDPGLGGYLLGLGEERIESRDPAALTELGHLMETFAVTEILKQAGGDDRPLRFGHFRTHDGDEVDLVIERPDGRIAGVEVKSSSRIADGDVSGLRTLRRRLKDRFLGGVVLGFVPQAYRAEDRIYVLPLSSLWRPPGLR